jgi:predicted aspartyl protease
MRMGIFSVAVEIENPHTDGSRRTVDTALVDTGAVLSWFPAAVLYALQIRRVKQWHFRQVDGSILTRWTGEVRLHVNERTTIDEVVFAEESDLVLLGARSLEGLNLSVDPVTLQLVDRGPAPAAVGLESRVTA